ncbi:hypothetical protein D9756_010288 [Leucocoprinus leucothites]|uniref:TauD/TfdA-like domain-containing protein n=1 Tax=Leucocoprinus leucothites TaxID=201217 RepID=A0A8H5CTG6_9AGAR|nr:hypothetical protein D9756_010288 [Leucoagaricus leucothites]
MPEIASTNQTTPSFLGSLAQFESYDLTTAIGTLFPNNTTSATTQCQLSEILGSPEADSLVRDLAILVAHRGVVFFKNQDLSVEKQKELGIKLGKLSWGLHGAYKGGSVGTVGEKTSGLHIHPISEDVPELGKQVSVISSEKGISRTGYMPQARASHGWHSDITFENVPSDYAILRMHTLPPVGGDTLWASGYGAYDRLSPAYQKFLGGLTAFHDGTMFHSYIQEYGGVINEGPRGAPENVGTHLTAVHPVVRTNPVTGLKTLFVNKEFTKRINELTSDESDHLLDYLTRQFSENHDIQVRYRWEKNDVAIWDNRVTVHTATNDYSGKRQGNRIVSLGERPFFDPESKSRREALGI